MKFISIQKKTKLKNRVYEESSIFKVVGFACKEKNITLEIVPEIKLSAVDGKLQKKYDRVQANCRR